MPAEEARMALRGFSKFEQMFRAKLASDAPLQVLNTTQYHAIPRNTNFVSDAPLQVLKARKEKEGLSKEEVRTKE